MLRFFFLLAGVFTSLCWPHERTLDLSGVANGRLTLTSGTAVTSSDVTAAPTLYYTPYLGNQIALYTGTAWVVYSLSELSLALTVTSDNNYDVFVYDNGGTRAIELSNAWTNDTTRSQVLTLQDGIYVKSGAPTKRYVGTIRASGANVTEDSAAKRFVWNLYNQASRNLWISDALNSWSYSTASWRASNNSASNRVQIVNGIAGGMLKLTFNQAITTNSGVYHAICEGCTNGYTAGHYGYVVTSSQFSIARLTKIPAIGYYYYQMVESGNGTTVFAGGANGNLMGTWPC